jgi:PIN domain nuclease of toxin-antitoxin system
VAAERSVTHLIDAHLLLWAVFDPDRLPPKATKILQSRQVPQAFSLATSWAVASKTSLGRADFSLDPGRLHRALLAQGFVELPIAAAHVARVAALPWIHRDPFDRLLVAQAIEEKLTLLTADAVLKGYGRFVKVC